METEVKTAVTTEVTTDVNTEVKTELKNGVTNEHSQHSNFFTKDNPPQISLQN